MSFLKAVKTCLTQKYFAFGGRSGRSEFWWFFLFQLIVSIVAAVIHEVLYVLVVLVLLPPALGAAIRRLHDTGRSGWWLLLGLIPVIGLVLLYFFLQSSTQNANAYGDAPPHGNLPGSALPELSAEFKVAETTPIAVVVVAPGYVVPEQVSRNYFVRHWRGDLSLATSYWLNGFLIAAVGPLIVLAILSEYVTRLDSLRINAFVYVFAIVVTLMLWLWGIVGIWRSSDNHVARGGVGAYASLAKVAVALGMLSMVGQLTSTYLPTLKDMMLIVLGSDPVGNFKATVLSDGKSILVKGALREGAAKEIEKVMDSAPAVRTLVLSSHGGRLLEGKLLAMAVSKRALNTYVEDICVSTCTFVFLAGKERAATPNAKIGFHTPSFPGADPEMRRGGLQFMMEVYRQAGLRKDFLDRVASTPATSMWYPTRDELIEARVITRLSLGGETTTTFTRVSSKNELLLLLRSLPLWLAMERRFPQMVDRAIDRGWKVKEQGGNDGQISSAMRTVVAETVPVLLRDSSIKSIEIFVTLMVDQMRTARAISYQACGQLLNAQLNPMDAFPKHLREREEQWMLEAMNAEPVITKQYSRRAIENALAVVSSKIRAENLDVIANPANYKQRPDLVCDSMLVTYEVVLSLPSEQRAAAMEGMFKSGT